MKQGVLLLKEINILEDGHLDGRLSLEVGLDIVGEADGSHALAVGASKI